MPTALIAEDQPVLAAEIQEALGRLWPQREIASVVHDGVSAVRELRANTSM